MTPLSPKLESLFVIINNYVGLTHRELTDKVPPTWYSTNNHKKELTNALERLKKTGRIVGRHDDGVYVYQSVKPAEPTESEPMNTDNSEQMPTDSEQMTPKCSDPDSKCSEPSATFAALAEMVSVPILPDDVETLTVYRVRGTDKCFETVDEVVGYRAALNRKRFAAKVADCVSQNPGPSVGVLAVEAVMDYIEVCGGNLVIPEVAP